MAEVFELPVSAMLTPPKVALLEAVREAVEGLGEHQRVMYKAYRDFKRDYEILHPFLRSEDDWQQVQLLISRVEGAVMGLVDIAMEAERALTEGEIDAAKIKFPSTRRKNGEQQRREEARRQVAREVPRP